MKKTYSDAMQESIIIGVAAKEKDKLKSTWNKYEYCLLNSWWLNDLDWLVLKAQDRAFKEGYSAAMEDCNGRKGLS